jgi:AcrR family transcriptional regulator
MARPKEFDQQRALDGAISIFSQKGFAATSTDDLMRAMDVGRQSMYDTFGDKRALFLKALEVYVTEKVRSINVELQSQGSPSVPCVAMIDPIPSKRIEAESGFMKLNMTFRIGSSNPEGPGASASCRRVSTVRSCAPMLPTFSPSRQTSREILRCMIIERG